jgi:hypothetical protein
MRLRADRSKVTDEEERALEASVRELSQGQVETPHPADAYWQNLIIRINKRVDEATSGKAISLSWAARVAIPGVVAVLSFLIGLRYYAPDRLVTPASLLEATSTLPSATIDSLVALSLSGAENAPDETVAGWVLSIPHEMASDYLCEYEGTTVLLGDLSDTEVKHLLSALGSGPN